MVYANCYVYSYMVVDGDEILEQGRYIDMNACIICLGCGDEMFGFMEICEECWNGEI